jgi:nitronate monooxygenase
MSNWKNTAVTQWLNIDVPIIQGPFGGGLSSVELVATVSEAGGLGSFGAHHLTAPQIRETADAIRKKTQRPFALNLWIPNEDTDNPQLTDEEFDDYLALLKPYFNELAVPLPLRPVRYIPKYQEQIEAILETRPAVFSFVFGTPAPDIISRCKELNIVTIGAATTADEAIALEDAGVDMVLATGFEAGGHRPSFLRPAEDSLTGTFALVPQVVDAINAPVIAAGGIADGRGIAAALALGAQAVQIGTAFLACTESSASKIHRQKLFSSEARYTALTRAYSGRLARGISNRLMEELLNQQNKIAPYPVQNWLTGQIKTAAIEQGRTDLMSLWSGQAASLLQHQDAKSLLNALVEETDSILKTDGG